MDATWLIILPLIIFYLITIGMFARILKRLRGNKKDKKERVKTYNRDAANELLALTKSILNDWNNNRYSDKIETETKYNGKIVTYTFEDGNVVQIDSTNNQRKLKHKTKSEITTYNVSTEMWEAIIMLFNMIIRQVNNSQTNSRYSNRRYTSVNKPTPKVDNPFASHPKWDRYWGLILNIRQRTANLEELSDTDPNRSGLINELNTAKRQAKAMKEKYKF